MKSTLGWYQRGSEVLNPLRYHVDELIGVLDHHNAVAKAMGETPLHPEKVAAAIKASNKAEKFFTGSIPKRIKWKFTKMKKKNERIEARVVLHGEVISEHPSAKSAERAAKKLAKESNGASVFVEEWETVAHFSFPPKTRD